MEGLDESDANSARTTGDEGDGRSHDELSDAHGKVLLFIHEVMKANRDRGYISLWGAAMCTMSMYTAGYTANRPVIVATSLEQ